MNIVCERTNIEHTKRLLDEQQIKVFSEYTAAALDECYFFYLSDLFSAAEGAKERRKNISLAQMKVKVGKALCYGFNNMPQ